MLRVDLAELLRQTGKNIVVDLNDAPSSDEDVTYLAPAVGRVTISNAGELVLVRGRFATKVQFECGRCLGEVREPINAEIEEQYSLTDVENPMYRDTQTAIVSDDENEVPPGLMDGTVMDLNVLLRQSVILNAPISPVCKEECLGLCPACGKNRNDSSSGCRCGRTARNTPLAALKQMFDARDEGDPAASNGASHA